MASGDEEVDVGKDVGPSSGDGLGEGSPPNPILILDGDLVGGSQTEEHDVSPEETGAMGEEAAHSLALGHSPATGVGDEDAPATGVGDEDASLGSTSTSSPRGGGVVPQLDSAEIMAGTCLSVSSRRQIVHRPEHIAPT